MPYLQLRGHRIDEVTTVHDNVLALAAGWEDTGSPPDVDDLDPLTDCSFHDKQGQPDLELGSESTKKVQRLVRFAQDMMKWEIQRRRISRMDGMPRAELLKPVFVTNQSIGLARGDVVAGDSIWVLENTDMPFVLRREGDHYVLVGECYLHRAGEESRCLSCGVMIPWHMVTEIIDLW
jgi:hypothetical protein